MPPEAPVFGSEDRVSQVELPAEIRNETDPKKIAAYYQRREGQIREEMRRTAATPPNSRVQIEQRVDNPPERREPAQFSVEEASSARATLIATARQTAKAGKEYWDRLSADIEKVMSEQPPENQVNVNIWETAYNTILGMNMQRLIREDTAARETAARTATERASAPPEQQTAPAPLPVEVTAKILPGLGINEEQYRTSQDNIAKGVWPLTSENVNGRRTTIGGR
jgi:hypothetical protein